MNVLCYVQAVEISYCDRDPLSYDLTIKLTKDGIKLVFDSISQRLKVIEVYDLSLVRLKYRYKAFFHVKCNLTLSLFLSHQMLNCLDSNNK